MALPELSQAALRKIALANARADEIELAADLQAKDELGHHITGADSWKSFDHLFYDSDLLPPYLKQPLQRAGQEYAQAAVLRFDALAEGYFNVIMDSSEFEGVLPQLGVKHRKIPPVSKALKLQLAHWVTRSRERALATAPSAKSIEVTDEPTSRERGTTKRLPSSITSPVAAKRMEEYLRNKPIGQTEFAGKVGTTDRTLRRFRKTGTVRRDIFDAIAGQMGTTRDGLLKPE